MGLLDVWLYRYKPPNKDVLAYWIFHLKHPHDLEDRHTNYVFYDSEQEKWTTLDLKGFDFNHKNCERVTDYEKLSRAWKNYLRDTNPPFALTDIFCRRLQVWTWYSPINEDQKKECPAENIFWVFHLKVSVTMKINKGMSTKTSK